MCRGESERFCLQCHVALPQQRNDYLCESCGLGADAQHLAEVVSIVGCNCTMNTGNTAHSLSAILHTFLASLQYWNYAFEVASPPFSPRCAR